MSFECLQIRARLKDEIARKDVALQQLAVETKRLRGVIRALVEVLAMAQIQVGKRTAILKDGTEEIECLLIPQCEANEALALGQAELSLGQKEIEGEE